jgi:hypothetical protein
MDAQATALSPLIGDDAPAAESPVTNRLPGCSNRRGLDAAPGAMPVGLAFAPNPLVSGRVTLRYSLPKAGAASISVYDVTGRSVLSRSLVATRTGAVSLDVRSLSAGIYLVRLDADQYTTTSKLVVQR